MLKEVLDKIDKKDTLKIDFTQNELDYLYNLGVRYMQANDYAKATPIFQLLASSNPTNLLYMKGLAGCFQASGNFMDAVFSYKFVYLLDMEKNNDCLFYCGVCLYKIDNFLQAKTEFKSFVDSPNAEPEMVERANLYLAAIEKQLAKDQVKKEEDSE